MRNTGLQTLLYNPGVAACLLSVITPVYNAEKTLRRTLDSLGAIAPKHRSSVEIILINDGSVDGSQDIIDRYIQEDHFHHVRALKKPNGGSASARNLGLDHTSGKWLFFLDSDDELLIDPIPMIEECTDSTSIICSVDIYKYDKRHSRFGPPRIGPGNRLDVLTSMSPNYPCQIFLQSSSMDTRFNPEVISREDWLFWLTNPRIYDRVARKPDVTCAIVHSHGSNKSSNYKRAGRFRQVVAKLAMADLSDQLTKKQRNNLKIQIHIGAMIQNPRFSLSHLVSWPCSLSLWLKLLVYNFFGKTFQKIDYYGRGRDQ